MTQQEIKDALVKDCSMFLSTLGYVDFNSFIMLHRRPYIQIIRTYLTENIKNDGSQTDEAIHELLNEIKG